ncbi:MULTISPECIES: hypothetical protein [Cupriavidus]
MKANQTSAIPVVELVLLKQATCNKLSVGAAGDITYQIASTPDKKHIYLSLQDSGSKGYFSREWVDAEKIATILDEAAATLSGVTSKVFRPAFSGQSSNNAPFLAAALLSEGLLKKDGVHGLRLHATGDIDNWLKKQLSQKGKPIRVRMDGKPIEAAAASENESTRKDTTHANRQTA